MFQTGAEWAQFNRGKSLFWVFQILLGKSAVISTAQLFISACALQSLILDSVTWPCWKQLLPDRESILHHSCSTSTASQSPWYPKKPQKLFPHYSLSPSPASSSRDDWKVSDSGLLKRGQFYLGALLWHGKVSHVGWVIYQRNPQLERGISWSNSGVSPNWSEMLLTVF